MSERDRRSDTAVNHVAVVHFILDARIGGPHAYVAALREALMPSVRSTIVTAGRGPMSDVALLNLRRYARPLYPVEVLANAILIGLRYGVRRRPALFHVHGVANLAPLLAAWLCRMPVVWHYHEILSGYRFFARIGAWLLERIPHRILTVARLGNTVFTQQRATLVPGLLDTSFWKATTRPVQTAPDARNTPLRILTVANLNPLKGVDVLLKALPHVGQPIKLTVIGAELDSHREHIRLIREWVRNLEDAHPTVSIELAGSRSPEYIRTALSQSDIYVLPSRSEACPIALLEAMAMAKPCVATDVGAVRDILPAEQQAYVCPPEDPVKLGRAIRSLIDLEPEARRHLGARNRQAVEMNHSPEKIRELVKTAYLAVLDGNHAQQWWTRQS